MIRKLLILSMAALSGAFTTAFAESPKVYREAEQAFLERTSLKAADEKCGYFTDLERSALISGQLQSRGALLRSGLFTLDAINAAEQEVIYFANTRPCGDPDFMEARAHLKSAFEAFVGTMVMDYPGLERTWYASRSRWDTWRVVQNGSSKKWLFKFGLLAPPMGDPDDYPATFSRPLNSPLQTEPFTLALDVILSSKQSAPSLARIHLRDELKAPEPWLGNLFGDEIEPPPIGLTTAIWSSGRTVFKHETSGETHVRFTFSPEATAAIAKLDPREQFEIAIFPNARSGETKPYFLTIEVGDFAAAHAFTKLPPL